MLPIFESLPPSAIMSEAAGAMLDQLDQLTRALRVLREPAAEPAR